MNATDPERPALDRRLIARLVDGELSSRERRELLLRLDQEPDGWRTCALAFLEAQAWREALRPASTRNTGNVHRLGKLALAASLVPLLFALGWMAARMSGSEPLRSNSADLVQQHTEPRPPATAPDLRGESTLPVQAVGYVQLPGSGAGRDGAIEVPILAGPNLDERWLRTLPPSVPDDLRQQWRELGYNVQQRRRLVSMEVGDGRFVAIPVDEVELDYVGPRAL